MTGSVIGPGDTAPWRSRAAGKKTQKSYRLMYIPWYISVSLYDTYHSWYLIYVVRNSDPDIEVAGVFQVRAVAGGDAARRARESGQAIATGSSGARPQSRPLFTPRDQYVLGWHERLTDSH